jgi:hypothetical protein
MSRYVCVLVFVMVVAVHSDCAKASENVPPAGKSGTVAAADTPSQGQASNGGHGYKTVEELFVAYKKATEEKDWKTLFLLRTPDMQDIAILGIAVNAATSKDATCRSLVEKHGGNWKQFDHTWTEAENQRFTRDYAAIARSFGTTVADKVGLFVATRSYIDKVDPASTQDLQLKNLAYQGATAEGDAIGKRTCIGRSLDTKGNVIGQFPTTGSLQSHLRFRQIDGRWHLATQP